MVDTLQLSHVRDVRELARLVAGTSRPVAIADGSREVMTVWSPRALEEFLFGPAGNGSSPDRFSAPVRDAALF